jgi:DNA damage-inducible protein 1
MDKNVLRIQGQEIPFLAEHELPEKARIQFNLQGEEIAREAAAQSSQPSGSSSQSHFPGAGNRLGSTPAQLRDQLPEENAISTLVSLGATREQAIQCLLEAGGNVDIAAFLLFN